MARPAVADHDRSIDLYRVGFLDALHRDWRAITIARRRPTATLYELRLLAYWLRRRNWRAARNAANGWLAEHAYAGTRAGHGWTRRRALADLHHHLDELARKDHG
jgi:hypothetical protein